MDHIGYSSPTTLENSQDSGFPSDHVPITTTISIPLVTQAQARQTTKIRHVLERNLTHEDMLRIMHNRRWPQIPFYRAAAQIGLARKCETHISEFEKVKHALEQIELLQNPGATLESRLSGLRELMR